MAVDLTRCLVTAPAPPYFIAQAGGVSSVIIGCDGGSDKAAAQGGWLPLPSWPRAVVVRAPTDGVICGLDDTTGNATLDGFRETNPTDLTTFFQANGWRFVSNACPQVFLLPEQMDGRSTRRLYVAWPTSQPSYVGIECYLSLDLLPYARAAR